MDVRRDVLVCAGASRSASPMFPDEYGTGSNQARRSFVSFVDVRVPEVFNRQLDTEVVGMLLMLWPLQKSQYRGVANISVHGQGTLKIQVGDDDGNAGCA